MAWLFLDTHAAGSGRVGWLMSDAHKSRAIKISGRSKHFLSAIQRLVKRAGSLPEGICVVAGPGTFSAVRGGVLYANLLARLWRLPLVGIRVDQAVSLKILARELFNRLHLDVSYVAPLYDREPNITAPKTRA